MSSSSCIEAGPRLDGVPPKPRAGRRGRGLRSDRDPSRRERRGRLPLGFDAGRPDAGPRLRCRPRGRRPRALGRGPPPRGLGAGLRPISLRSGAPLGCDRRSPYGIREHSRLAQVAHELGSDALESEIEHARASYRRALRDATPGSCSRCGPRSSRLRGIVDRGGHPPQTSWRSRVSASGIGPW